MANDNPIYLSSSLLKTSGITAFLACLLAVVIFVTDSANMTFWVLLGILAASLAIVAVLLLGEIVVNSTGITYKGKKTEWNEIISVELDDKLYMNTSSHGRISISSRYEKFYYIVSQIRRHATVYDSGRRQTDFNDKMGRKLFKITESVIAAIFLIASLFVIFGFEYFGSGALLLLSLVVFVLGFSNIVHETAAELTNDAIIVHLRYPFKKQYSFDDIKKVWLTDANERELVIQLTNGKKKHITNSFKNGQFLYDNLRYLKDNYDRVSAGGADA